MSPWPLAGLRGPLAKLDTEEEVAVHPGVPDPTSEQAALLHTIVGRRTCALRLLTTPSGKHLSSNAK